MDKLEMQTPNFTDENIEKLAGIFPNCVTESKDDSGKLKKSIDFDLLKQELSENIVDGPRERYQINWPGKKEALVSANTPINKTLRPCREESVDFDTTENLYIEGDNLEALKLLQESYLGKVKMIYIDPPYNTGNDFVYNDKYNISLSEYEDISGVKDNLENKLIAEEQYKKNQQSNGRYHSDWMSMIYTRLKLARNLLKDDGAIFISIDDNEVSNLRKICDEIFGENNFVGEFIWKNKHGGGGDSPYIVAENENILVLSKDILKLEHFFGKAAPEYEKLFRYKDERGKYYLDRLDKKGIDSNRPNLIYPIECPDGTMKDISPAIWRLSKKEFERRKALNIIEFKKDKNDEWQIYTKTYLYDENGIKRKVKPRAILKQEIVGFTQNGNKEIIELFDRKLFDNPKPISLLEYLQDIIVKKDDLILDFFSGSGTTAHSLMQLNKEDNGNRKYILVQLPEQTEEKSEAYKAGYKTIPEIGKERIRRAGRKIKEENADKEGIEDLDIGFRVLKIDSSNMKDIYYAPDQMSQSLLDSQEQNIKEDRTTEDLLFQVLLDWGVDLTLPIKREEIHGKTVYFVDEDTLVACFDDGLDAEFAKEIAARKPLRAVFKENGYKQDEDKINIDQVILQFSPDTEVRAI